MMHNHGPEEGAGLACNELALPDGSRKGACIVNDTSRVECGVSTSDFWCLLDVGHSGSCVPKVDPRDIPDEVAIREWAKREFVRKGVDFQVKVVATGETTSMHRKYFKIVFPDLGLEETTVFEVRFNKITGETKFSAFQDFGMEILSSMHKKMR